jgi:hypothetical protein
MKQILLNAFAILGIAFISVAQDGIVIKIAGENTDYSSGHAPYVTSGTIGNEIVVDFEIENTSGNQVTYRISRLKDSNVPSDWTNMVCVGTSCFANSPNNPYCTPSNAPLVLSNNATSQMPFHINPNSVATGATFTLYVGTDCSSFVDSVKVRVDATASVKEVKQNPSFSMFPNPSDEFVSIQLNNTEKGLVKVVDLLGNVIYSESIFTSSKINTSDFKNGVYFVTIESEGVKLASRKLVVRH